MISYSLTTQRVATGSSYGALPDDEHAKLAVQSAIAKMDANDVGSVLLFLSSAYAHAPQSAIKEAVKAAGTLQVFGCCALNLLTEEEWLMDVEGAVAMVFPRDLSLQPLKVVERLGQSISSVLTLASPNAAAIAINSTNNLQFGSVTTDEYGHGPYSIWQSGHIAEHEFSLTSFPSSLETHIVVADGIKRLSENMQINLTDSHTLNQVGEQSALDSLAEEVRAQALAQPFNLLCAVSETNDVKSLLAGHYTLHHVVAIDEKQGAIQLSGKAKAGKYMFWAKRDADQAEKLMQKELLSLQKKVGSKAVFALMFPNIGRGADFYGGRDRDLDCFQGAFPDTPLIGFYGNGEITPGHKLEGLIKQYSTVIAIFSEKQD